MDRFSAEPQEHVQSLGVTPGPIGSVLVVGAGIGGMQAALDLAEAGFHVTLVEESSAIGGHMAQLDKTFPTNDCSMCTLSPKLIEVGKHRNIDLRTQTEVLDVQGEPGRFRVRLRTRPRYVLLDKCNACGDCVAVCPVELPNEFDEGLSGRKAIFKQYPQAIPGAMAISKQARAPCVLACPGEVNCQGYVALVSQGRFSEAYALIRQQNPFPGVCGRICHHPCEQACHRIELDEPVAINPLKRFVADWVASQRASGQEVCPPEPAKIDPARAPVGIVGGGPAGLTAARDLAQRGYPVTLFEAELSLGGTMRSAIPAYRLPDGVLDRDIEEILAAGFAVRLGKVLGRDFSLEDLRREGYRAIFLALGCTRAVPLQTNTEGASLEGRDWEGVILGLDFLRQVKRSREPRLHGRVVVIGGGNVAMDVALCARRQGADQVEIVCLESRDEMPAHPWEVLEALEEGIRVRPGWGVYRIMGEAAGKVNGLVLQRCTAVFDAQGRFSPRFAPQWDTIAADTVLVAIGQQTDLSFLPKDDPLWASDRRRIQVDPLSLQTAVEWVFAGGDMVSGPSSVVEAVAQGHRAAESINRYLQGENWQAYRTLLEQRSKPEPAPRPERWFPRVERVRPSRLPVSQRQGFEEIEQTLSAEEAMAEARRCLACGLCSECLECVKACKAEAILHQMLPQEQTLEVGAILLSPGFECVSGSARPEYGYGIYKNVITSLEWERILSASGPFQGRLRRPSDHKEPKRIAWIQCVGSRDVQLGQDHCSSVCCTYALKEAMMAVDHGTGLQATIFANDIRTFGKGFEAYYETAIQQYGVRIQRGLIAGIKERPTTGNLLIGYVDDAGRSVEEEFDLVVLSVGLRPSAKGVQLAERLGVKLDPTGFCQTEPDAKDRTSREGIFVAGAFAGPVDIPETVMSASAASAAIAARLQQARGTQVRKKQFPAERDVTGEPPRIGVFVCRCGTNIARVINTTAVMEYARGLPGVVYVEENLYTCSTDTQHRIIQAIEEYRLNRVVVASCTPRTHEPLFQETLREAGLNKHLFEMANIRDQCSWVHARWPEQATEKAKDLVRMAVARAARLRPLADVRVQVEPRAFVLGAGVAGLTAAWNLAEQGFATAVVEKESVAGGLARRLLHSADGVNVPRFLNDLIRRVQEHPKIQLYLNAQVEEFGGHVGQFRAVIQQADQRTELRAGAVIIATGAAPYQPSEYGFGRWPAVLTQLELEERLREHPRWAQQCRQVVMIQCVGSREPEAPYCSRVCCIQAVKNALALKEAHPEIAIYVLYRDMRTYGLYERMYRQAREAGVLFLRFDPQQPPQVESHNGALTVRVQEETLGRPLVLRPDWVVLSAGVRPGASAQQVSQLLKTPLTADGFFLEAHMKLRPLDVATEGIFLAGLAHGPKLLSETILQAKGAAARAATLLSQQVLDRSGIVSEVDSQRCAACLTCVRLCPYDVPQITEEGVAWIEPAQCQGCGVCASACPRKAIHTRHYEDEQLLAKLEVLWDRPDRPSARAEAPAAEVSAVSESTGRMASLGTSLE